MGFAVVPSQSIINKEQDLEEHMPYTSPMI